MKVIIAKKPSVAKNIAESLKIKKRVILREMVISLQGFLGIYYSFLMQKIT